MNLNRKSLSILVLLIASMLVSGVVVSAQESAVVDALDSFLHDINEQGFYIVQPNDVNTQMKVRPNLYILDVRTPSEVEEGIIPDAHTIRLSELAKSLDELPEGKGTTMYVYCKAGTRAAYAVAALHTLGYTEAYNIAGGFTTWKDQGLPVETP